MQYRIIETATGHFVLMADGVDLRSTWIEDLHDPLLHGAEHEPALRPDLVSRLQAYFAGEAVDFDDVPTPAGAPFFRRCWEACRAIPRGSTRSYAELAEAAGSPGAARAAGQAMRHNPLPVIVPCHRILAARGGLGGFAGRVAPDSPELRRKRQLLDLEAAASALAVASPVFAPC